jgi:hypothetical protein
VERSGHEQYSPAGQIDQWGDLASGLRNNRAGRRRAARMLLGLLLVVLVGGGLLFLLALTGVLG